MSDFFDDPLAGLVDEISDDLSQLEPEAASLGWEEGENQDVAAPLLEVSTESPSSDDVAAKEALKSEILQGLNREQCEAVVTTEGPLLVLAGAGSGKTTVLTKRIAWILQAQLAKSYQIFGVTFTNKAARELSDRLHRLCGVHRFTDVGTFHSVCSRWLRREADTLGISSNYSICDAGSQLVLMRNVIKELNFDNKKYEPKKMLTRVSHYKNEGTRPDVKEAFSREDYRFVQIFDRYNLRLHESDALDFDDILLYTVNLFKDHPEILEQYANRLKYILVDEYQDVNGVQYELLRLLSSRHHNICAVGDDDQSIYKFRGADLSIILRFEQDFSDAKVIKLEQNYRSTQPILDVANQVVSHNEGRKGKNLWSKCHEGGRPVVYGARNAQDEALFVANTIQTMMAQGYHYADFAVLYRANAMSRNFEEIFIKGGIVHKIVGGQRFYERREIKDLLAYLSLFNNSKDSISLRRVLEHTPRVGTVTQQKLAEYGIMENLPLYDTLVFGERLGISKGISEVLSRLHEWIAEMGQLARQRATLAKLLQEVLQYSNYREVARKYCDNDADYTNRMENIDELISTVMSFDSTYQGRETPLAAFMAEVSLFNDQDGYEAEQDKVTLMTIHTSKGLEFSVVFLVGLEENTLPSYLSLQTGLRDDVEEERRLCYVGMTRAKRRLFLTFAIKRDKQGIPFDMDVSRFLREVDYDLLEVRGLVAPSYLGPGREQNAFLACNTENGAFSSAEYSGNYYGGAAGNGSGYASGSRSYGARSDSYNRTRRQTEKEKQRLALSKAQSAKQASTRRSLEQLAAQAGNGAQLLADRPAESLQRGKAEVNVELKKAVRHRSKQFEQLHALFTSGRRVSHKLHGIGVVKDVDKDIVTVSFGNGVEREIRADYLTVIEAEPVRPVTENEAAVGAVAVCAGIQGEDAAPAQVDREPRVGDWLEFPVWGRGIIQEINGAKSLVAVGGMKRVVSTAMLKKMLAKQH